MVEQYGIKWILVNNWGGEGFETRTFAANLPTGILFRTIDRFEQANVNKPNFGQIKTNTSIEFVPNLRILADDAPSGEWPAIEEKMEMALDPRFLRSIQDDQAPDLDVTRLGDPEPTFVPREPRIRLDDQAPNGSATITIKPGRTDPKFDDLQTELDAEAGHFEPHLPPPKILAAVARFAARIRRAIE